MPSMMKMPSGKQLRAGGGYVADTASFLAAVGLVLVYAVAFPQGKNADALGYLEFAIGLVLALGALSFAGKAVYHDYKGDKVPMFVRGFLMAIGLAAAGHAIYAMVQKGDSSAMVPALVADGALRDEFSLPSSISKTLTKLDSAVVVLIMGVILAGVQGYHMFQERKKQ